MGRRQPLAQSAYDPLAAFDPPTPAFAGTPTEQLRVIEAVTINPPSWVEAVAIVQSVCTRVGRHQMPPMLGDLLLTSDGDVRFAPGGVADHHESVGLLCRLLERLIGTQPYPVTLWVALERAKATPRLYSNPDDLGAAFGRVLPPGGPARLAAYARETAAMRRLPAPSAAPEGGSWLLRLARQSRT
jgi:hypothetical protein